MAFTGVGLFNLRLSDFPHYISKIDAARITKLHIEMFHYEFWKPIYFGIKRSISQNHRNIAGM